MTTDHSYSVFQHMLAEFDISLLDPRFLHFQADCVAHVAPAIVDAFGDGEAEGLRAIIAAQRNYADGKCGIEDVISARKHYSPSADKGLIEVDPLENWAKWALWGAAEDKRGVTKAQEEDWQNKRFAHILAGKNLEHIDF